MKKFLATLALLPVLASCSLPWGGSSTSPAPAAGGTSIVGKWKLSAMSLPKQEAEIAKQTAEIQSAFKSQVEEVVSKSTAEFGADGNFTISVADVSTKGTYKLSADGKVITTTIPQEDGTTKGEDINVVTLTKEQMVLRSAVAAEDGTTEELILTWVPAV